MEAIDIVSILIALIILFIVLMIDSHNELKKRIMNLENMVNIYLDNKKRSEMERISENENKDKLANQITEYWNPTKFDVPDNVVKDMKEYYNREQDKIDKELDKALKQFEDNPDHGQTKDYQDADGKKLTRAEYVAWLRWRGEEQKKKNENLFKEAVAKGTAEFYFMDFSKDNINSNVKLTKGE